MSCRPAIGIAVAIVLLSARLEAQNPPPGGYGPTPCRNRLPAQNVSFTLSDNNKYYWNETFDLISYYTGTTNYEHAKYGVYPYNSYLDSEPGPGGKVAQWINGEVDFWCWARHVVHNGVPTTDYQNQQGVYRHGNFAFKSEQLCDEWGNLVDTDGTPCSNQQPGDGNSGEEIGGSNCQTEYVDVQVDNGSGWVTIWSGDANVCSG